MPDLWAMTRLGNGWRYFRQHGLRAFLKRYVYRSEQWLVIRGGLSGPAALDHVGDIVFRLATPADLDHLDELERYGRGSIQRRHVEAGTDWLFVGCHNQRIVATERASCVVRDPLIARVVQLGAGQLWSADAFCLPEYRSQGISRQLGIFGQRFLAAQGYKESFGSISVSNTPALRMALHVGVNLAYYISYVRILFWERLRVSEDIPRRFWDGLK